MSDNGDDCVAGALLAEIGVFPKAIDSHCLGSTTVFGDSRSGKLEARVLNRILKCHGGTGLSHGTDPRHAEAITKACGVESEKWVAIPGVKAMQGDTEGGERE